jgi:NAD(P)-dependent dehydrogenase (short-subunit alcohol dehydrogenase family)
MSGPLANCRALIVGGGSGIGLATAALLAADGASVTIAGRTEAKLAAAAAPLAAAGHLVDWLVCDALDGDSVRRAVEHAAGDRGLDVAVAVPGGGAIGSVLLIDDDAFSRQIDANIRPAFLTLKYAGLAMRNRGGSIVAVSSTAAVLSSRYLAAYCAGKAAVDQLVRVAADELGQYGIRVNSVRPGLTRTDATDRVFTNEPMVEAFVAQQPLARSGEANDVAGAIRYLAGPESSWVTGQHLTVDGGHTLRAFVDYRTLIPITEP